MQNIVTRIVEIIAENFPNGIRDDFIDTNKVLRLYSANYPDENISRELIANVIHANGMEDGGQFYFISKSDIDNVKQLIEKIFETHAIAYYHSIYRKHANFLEQLHIFSPDVLEKILQTNDADHFYFSDFCTVDMTTRLDHEVAKIFAATKNSLSLDDLKEKLPYVPAEEILSVLSDTNKYFSTNTSKYASVYGRRLSKEDDDHKASEQRGTTKQLREFVAAHDELPYDELFDFAKNLNTVPSVAVGVAFEKMVRVDKNLFVKDELMTFDVDGIDEALSVFVQGKIIPLRTVTSFTDFPPVAGYSWNLFLLESFLRKFSRRYTYHTPAPNSANVGAIYPKSMKFKDYLDVQAAAVLQENIPLEKSAVEDFLIDRGFRKMRIAKVNQRVIDRAKEIDEQRHEA